MIANVQIKVNSPQYNAVLESYRKARGKTHQEVINRVAQQCNFRCVRPQTKGGVKRAKLGKFPLNATSDPLRGGKTKKQRFFYAQAAKRGAKKGKPAPFKVTGNIAGGAGDRHLTRAAISLRNRRRAAKGAMAAGFLVSARKLGLRKRGPKGAQPEAGKSASRSTGDRSTGRLQAESINAVEGSFEVGKPAMDRAIAATIVDMQQFATKLLQDTNNRFHAK